MMQVHLYFFDQSEYTHQNIKPSILINNTRVLLNFSMQLFITFLDQKLSKNEWPDRRHTDSHCASDVHADIMRARVPWPGHWQFIIAFEI